MTIQEANDIIKREHLEDYVCFDETDRCRAGKAIFFRKDGQWATYIADERGEEYGFTLRKSDNLECILDDFIKFARLMKIDDER